MKLCPTIMSGSMASISDIKFVSIAFSDCSLRGSGHRLALNTLSMSKGKTLSPRRRTAVHLRTARSSGRPSIVTLELTMHVTAAISLTYSEEVTTHSCHGTRNA